MTTVRVFTGDVDDTWFEDGNWGLRLLTGLSVGIWWADPDTTIAPTPPYSPDYEIIAETTDPLPAESGVLQSGTVTRFAAVGVRLAASGTRSFTPTLVLDVGIYGGSYGFVDPATGGVGSLPTLSFNPGNWNVLQYIWVYVTAGDAVSGVNSSNLHFYDDQDFEFALVEATSTAG
jgi:hypothetical protein